MEAPLINVSLGQTALYLQGGLTLNEDPLALFLRGGDVMLMHGDEREAYHGVPRILKDASFLPYTSTYNSDTDTLSYLSENRINITVRQVNKK